MVEERVKQSTYWLAAWLVATLVFMMALYAGGYFKLNWYECADVLAEQMSETIEPIAARGIAEETCTNLSESGIVRRKKN